jgi:hypothetical protein
MLSELMFAGVAVAQSAGEVVVDVPAVWCRGVDWPGGGVDQSSHRAGRVRQVREEFTGRAGGWVAGKLVAPADDLAANAANSRSWPWMPGEAVAEPRQVQTPS